MVHMYVNFIVSTHVSWCQYVPFFENARLRMLGLVHLTYS